MKKSVLCVHLGCGVQYAYIMRRVYSCTSIYYIFIMFMGTCMVLSNVYCIIIMDTNVFR